MATTNPAEHTPVDIWLLLCANYAPHNKPKVISVLKRKTSR